jgi:DNA modification methylase
MDVIRVSALPKKPQKGKIYTIETKDVSYYTHGIYKYPCKFIPQIPSWAIENLLPTKAGSVQTIYDPFAGSGTTLVEGVLHGLKVIGSEIDPLGRLITKVKSERYSQKDIEQLELDLNNLVTPLNRKNSLSRPLLPNLEHWFTGEAIHSLANLHERITLLENKKSSEFFKVIMASIVKKVSRADDASPKPYVSTRFSKPSQDPLALFEKKSKQALKQLSIYPNPPAGSLGALGKDARRFNRRANSVQLAITSPPYINAFDYVRSLKLENYWLGLVDEAAMLNLRKGSVGTESLSQNDIDATIHYPSLLTSTLGAIRPLDKKRALVVNKYFQDMRLNLLDVHRLLEPGSRYVVVVADSEIRGVHVQTRKILSEIAASIGLTEETYFGYTIENRYLRIPRQGKGGLMKVDWVLVLRKSEKIV